MIFDRSYLLNILSGRVKAAWEHSQNAIPVSLPYMGGNEKIDNESRIAGSTQQFKMQVNGFPYPAAFFGRKKRWKKETESMLQAVLWKEPLLGMEGALPDDTLEEFKEQVKVFLKRVRAFDTHMEIGDIGQALRNYMVYAIFRELNGLPQKCKSSIFGYSMLYPYTDNYIDNPVRSREEKDHYNQLIADKICGNRYEALSVYEENTAKLLAAVEEDYERPDDIFDGLYLMLEAQRNSERQANTGVPLTEEEVFDISVFKGGLSVLIDRYFIDLPLSEDDLYFYYGFGFVLQLCDDLQDITQDKRNGSRTIFSICKSKEETAGKIDGLLRYTGGLFTGYKCRNEKFKQFLLRNSYLLILFSAAGSREHITKDYLLWIEDALPVSMDFYDEFKKSFSAKTLEKEAAKYGKILDALLL